MRRLLLLACALLLAAAAPPPREGPLLLCTALPPQGSCRPVDRENLQLDGPETILARTVTVDPASLPLARPSMVWVIAMASSEVRWNGVVIGRNGQPGPDRASEVPGRFVATFVVPAALVRPGVNLLSVRLSAHHLWLPVRTPIHVVEVAPYETPALPGLRAYLPALLMLGALLAALAYFGAAVAADRRDRRALIVASVAALGIAQLAVEVSRAFIAYTYPWHLARVSAIAVLASAIAILITAFAARRFAPGWRRPATALVAVACAASLIFVPSFDYKALCAVTAGALGLGVCAARGLGDQPRHAAVVALIAALLIVALPPWEGPNFLDGTYYLILAFLLVALIAEQVTSLRRARAERDAETRRAELLAERLLAAERNGERVLALKDGSRIHRVAEGDIVFVRAADDYCDVALADGRSILVTMSLARCLATLPEPFVRVHKSYAVNRPHVVALTRRAGGRALQLSDGSDIPVGRAYAAEVAVWLTPPPRPRREEAA